jgi:leucyl aminopeptidase
VPLSITASSTAPDRVAVELLAVPVAKSDDGTIGALGPGADVVDAALDGGLAAFLEETGFEGRLGDTLAVPTAGRLRAQAAIIVGIGDPSELTVDGLRRAAAAVAKKSRKAGSVATTLAQAGAMDGTDIDAADAAQAVTEGLVLGGYQYLDYKGDAKPTKLRRVTLLGPTTAAVRGAIERGSVIGDAVVWARDLVNRPAKEKSPASMAAAAQRHLRGTGVRVQVLDVAAIRAKRLGGVLGVGQGSQQTPRFLTMTYTPAGARGAALALVGKGVVFDSGGLSLKSGAGMETMKTDMSGGAAVIAAMSTLAKLGVKHKVHAYVPLVENMPSGTAIRPGDVLKIRNGKTVEVLNTDAEGRLILADALSLACDDGAAAIIDLATLTGACMVALGDKIAGLMANDDAWRDQVQAAADRAGEPVWPLPLPAQYRRLLESEVADLRNISSGSYGGAITAGLFLEEFVTTGTPWAHVDIAGPARANSDDGYLVRGGTGFGVRTLVELVERFEAPAKKTPAKKTPAKQTPAKKTPAKKTPAKKTASKKTVARAPAKRARR